MKRVVVEVGVVRGGSYLGMAKQAADDQQPQRTAGAETGVRVS